MIFKETILLESPAALLGALWLVITGSDAAVTGAQEEEDGGEVCVDEAGVAVRVVEVEANVGIPSVAAKGAAVEADEGKLNAAVTVAPVNVEEANSGVKERIDTG